MRRIAILLLTLFAFALPWEYALDLGEPFGNIARIFNLLTLLFTFPRVIEARKIRRPGLLQWFVVVLYLYIAASYFWSIDAATTLSKIRSYFQVMMTVWLVWELVEEPTEIRNLLRAFVAGCGVLAVLTLVNFASASVIAADQIRFVAEGQDPNDVARFLDLGLPLAVLIFAIETHKVVRWMALLCVPVCLLAVMLTASRGGFSASAVAMFGSGILLISWRPRAAGVIFASMLATAGAFWMMVPSGTLERLGTIPEQLISSDLNDRLNIWIAGWHAFAHSPWLGYGAGTYSLASGLALGDTAHNTLMAILVTGGVVGTTLFLLSVATVMVSIGRISGLLRIALGTTFAVWLVTGMVGSVEENRATWLLFALISSAARLTPNRQCLLLFAATPTKLSPEQRTSLKVVNPVTGS
jgi:O-antigen ligase